MTETPAPLPAAVVKKIDALVNHYKDNRHRFVQLQGVLQGMVEGSEQLQQLAHSVKFRIKDPEHLRDKLARKACDSLKARKSFAYTPANLFRKVNDLVGLRILHLYTHQFEQIHQVLLGIFDEYRMVQIEKPKARTWDDESRAYFSGIGIGTTASKTMYTSVHYVVKPNTRSDVTCEIQVRTLMEEVWGEVDHKINYPHESPVSTCREQIKVLARVTSGCSRLVDSIFLAHDERKLVAKTTRSKAKRPKPRQLVRRGSATR
jgi:ppGpp synthetase/RelA/SpoT-type nucleotidyltranferase